MNYRIIIRVLGALLLIESLAMTPSLFISLYTGETDTMAFLVSILFSGMLGFIMYKVPIRTKKVKVKESIFIVSIGWIFVSFFGALPLFLSGSVPTFIDGFFEMVSGFTTTGSTVISNVEALPKGILFWRSFSNWIGGMGILVLTVAILPALGVGSFQIFKAESSGPTVDRIVPRIKDTAKLLYTIYLAFTILLIVLLKFGGMNTLEAMLHTFSTVGTAGFSTRNASVGAFNSSYINIVLSIFMIISSINFSLYYQLITRNWKDLFKDEELRLFLIIISIATILIMIDLDQNIYRNIGNAFEHSLFQVSSIISTTGYATVDFNQWSTFSKGILFILIFAGGCAGSTAGGIKSIRILVLLKLIRREISKIFHPRAVIHVKVNDKALPSDTLASIMSFFALYIGIFIIGTIIISLEGIGLVSASSAVATSIGNVGPGFDFIGPTQTFSGFSGGSKLLLSLLMLFGRLELFTMLMLFVPKFWKDEM